MSVNSIVNLTQIWTTFEHDLSCHPDYHLGYLAKFNIPAQLISTLQILHHVLVYIIRSGHYYDQIQIPIHHP
jgi:hypothetical protein